MSPLHNPIQDTMVGISPSEIVSEDEKQLSIQIPNSPMKTEYGDPDPELFDLLNDVEEHIQRVLTSFTLSRKKPNFPLVQPTPNINNEWKWNRLRSRKKEASAKGSSASVLCDILFPIQLQCTSPLSQLLGDGVALCHASSNGSSCVPCQ